MNHRGLVVKDVVATMEAAGLTPVVTAGSVYAYADGPRTGLVESEWLLDFTLEADTVTGFVMEKRLVGP